VQKSLLSIINNAHFSADLVVVDGYDFAKSSPEEVRLFKEIASELGIEIWFSATLVNGQSLLGDTGIPRLLDPFNQLLSVIITLEPCKDFIKLNLVKDHEAVPNCDLHLKLDPQILLIADRD
jgi:hypothetical protein